ncbi:MAG: type II toxin-antitoxin system RelE family toxin [Pseudomarimonas sp.]
MVWRVELSTLGQKNVARLDPQTRERVLRFLFERVALLNDPRSIGDSLKGSELGSFWKYRVGDFRIIADIREEALCVLVVRIGKRREVYR